MAKVSSAELRSQPQYGTQIHLHNLGKSFGSVRVLSNLSLGVQPGESVAIVERIDCGKNTLLRLIASVFDRSNYCD